MKDIAPRPLRALRASRGFFCNRSGRPARYVVEEARSDVRAHLLLALGLIGCGAAEDTLPREPIWGQVTLDDAPLKAGSISFVSEGPAQGTAVASPPAP